MDGVQRYPSRHDDSMTSWSTINATSLQGIAFSPPSTRRKGDGFRDASHPTGYGLRDSGLPSDLPDGRAVENPVQSPLQKYFASPVGQIISTNSRHPVPPEGAYRDRHGRGVRMRWTRQRFARNGTAGRAMSL